MNKHLQVGQVKCLLFAAVIGVALGLSGCGGQDNSNISSVTGKEVPPGSTPLPPPAAPPGESAPQFKHP